MTAMSQESFPRKVYDENGRYTIAKTGAYEVHLRRSSGLPRSPTCVGISIARMKWSSLVATMK